MHAQGDEFFDEHVFACLQSSAGSRKNADKDREYPALADTVNVVVEGAREVSVRHTNSRNAVSGSFYHQVCGQRPPKCPIPLSSSISASAAARSSMRGRHGQLNKPAESRLQRMRSRHTPCSDGRPNHSTPDPPLSRKSALPHLSRVLGWKSPA